LTLRWVAITRWGMRYILFSAVLCLLLGVGVFDLCAADGPATFKVSEFNFQRPSQWEWVEVNSAMRKAQLKVVGAGAKEAAEVVFYYFGAGSGGGTDANVARWLGQFEEPKEKTHAQVDPVTVGQTKVTYVKAEGTYRSGMPGGPVTPMANYALVGAVIEGAEGSVFVKMTGPAAVAKAAQADFRKMVESALKR